MGTVLVANPLHIIKNIAGGIGGVFGSSKFSKQTYIETLHITMYTLLNKARKDGLMALETDVEEPDKSAVFTKNPAFLKITTFVTSCVTRCVWPSLAWTHSTSPDARC